METTNKPKQLSAEEIAKRKEIDDRGIIAVISAYVTKQMRALSRHPRPNFTKAQHIFMDVDSLARSMHGIGVGGLPSRHSLLDSREWAK